MDISKRRRSSWVSARTTNTTRVSVRRDRMGRGSGFKSAKFLAAGATIALSLGGLAGAPATAETRGPDAAKDAIAEAETAIKEFNDTGRVPGSALPDHDFSQEAPDAVFELADTLRERYEGSEGYGVVEWSKEARAALVWWYGPVPSNVTELVAETAAAAETSVKVAPMRYSSPALNKAAVEVLEASSETITSVTALHDGSGLEVSVSAPAQARQFADLNSADLGAAESFPVSVVAGGEVEPANSRVNQVAPYAGGARIETSGSGCTSAFGVMIANPVAEIDKPRGMLTAHHCGGWGVGHWVTNTNHFYGNKVSPFFSIARDSAILVNSPGPSGVPDTYPLYYPMMYVGAHNAGDRYIVVSGQTPVVGADWCTSGSYSGTWCYNEIVATNVYVNYGPGTTGPLVETFNYNGYAATGQGDSGGPTFRYMSAGSNGVFATGIISGIRLTGDTCIGLQWPDRECSTRGLYSPIYPVLSNTPGGITLMTNTNY